MTFIQNHYEALLASLHTAKMDEKLIESQKEDGCLSEANVVGVFTEALTAQVQVILANQTSTVGADTATIIQTYQ